MDTWYQDMMLQASGTIDEYFSKAVANIDEKFGEGYAKKNPALLASMINSTTLDYNNTIKTRALEQIGQALENVAAAVSEASNV